MSTIRKQLKTLVSDKIKNRTERLAQSAGNLEEQGAILADYRLYFDGGLDALRAAGIEESDTTPLVLAAETNEAELKLVEHRINLETELNADGE